MYAETCVLLEIRVGKQRGPLTLGEIALQQVEIRGSLAAVLPARVKQEEMIICFIEILVVLVIVSKAAQVLLSKHKIVELVLENNTCMEQSVFNYLVTLSHLFRSKRYLFQVILALVWIVLCAVERVLDRILHGLGSRYGVAHLVGKFLRHAGLRHDSLVGTLPVVDILAPSPQFLERSLTLADGSRVVKIPRPVLVGHVVGRVVLRRIAGSALLGKILLGLGFSLRLAFLLFFLFQSLDYTVDGLVPLGLGHLGKSLQ